MADRRAETVAITIWPSPAGAYMRIRVAVIAF